MSKHVDLHKQAQPLIQRIDLQKKYGTRDLTDWFLEVAAPRSTDTVLDIGCGSGNHLIAFANVCAGAVGIDISKELIAAAKSTARSLNLTNVHFIEASGDTFDLVRERFSIIMCNFGIYYMDVPDVVSRIAHYLTPEGTAYIMGSPDENAKELLDIHRQSTGFLPDLYAPGYSDIRKYEPIFRSFFAGCTFHRFYNPIHFPSPIEFLHYYEATTLFQCTDSVDPDLKTKVAKISEGVFKKKGKITITKVVDTAELKGPLQNV